MEKSEFRFWAVVPAAGSSSRMLGSTEPKQYLPVAGRCVLEWSVAPFLARQDCAGIVVVLAADDRRWDRLSISREARIMTATGGGARADSVRLGLQALRAHVEPGDWVLVHDAARPCLSSADLAALLEGLRNDEVGGLLATPVVDTLKRADGEHRVAQTVQRDGLWRACTPQMFRFELLARALAQAAERRVEVTDEAQALELLGLRPRLIAGSADNIKITVPEDLARAERILNP